MLGVVLAAILQRTYATVAAYTTIRSNNTAVLLVPRLPDIYLWCLDVAAWFLVREIPGSPRDFDAIRRKTNVAMRRTAPFVVGATKTLTQASAYSELNPFGHLLLLLSSCITESHVLSCEDWKPLSITYCEVSLPSDPASCR